MRKKLAIYKNNKLHIIEYLDRHCPSENSGDKVFHFFDFIQVLGYIIIRRKDDNRAKMTIIDGAKYSQYEK